MKRSFPPFWRAVFLLVGTTVGAGIFGLPSMFSRVGVGWGTILFVCIAFVVLHTNLLFADICASTRNRLRLVGYSKQYLGLLGHWLAAWVYPLSVLGANVVYILLGGEFLSALMHKLGVGGLLQSWQLVFWLVGCSLVFFGLTYVSRFEHVATVLLIVAMFVVSLVGLASGDWFVALASSARSYLAPFGIFLFSLYGLSAVGEVSDLLQRNDVQVHRAVTYGTLISALISWFFGVSLALAGRGFVGNDLRSLLAVIPSNWAWLMILVGFLAVITSFVMSAQDLKATFHLDFGWHKTFAWMLSLFIPLILLFMLRRSTFQVIGSIGALFLGINGTLVALIAGCRAWRSRATDRDAIILTTIGIAVFYLVGMFYHFVIADTPV